jgi:hypothetical protein
MEKNRISDYEDYQGNFSIFHILCVQVFTLQTLTNFCNPPLQFIDLDTRRILGKTLRIAPIPA